MSNRTIVKYLEPRNEHGPHWSLNIERSSSGEPTVLIEIEGRMYDGSGIVNACVVVENAPAVLAPLFDWLKEKEGA